MVMGLVSVLSLANHSDRGSSLVVLTLLSQDGCQREAFWEVVRHGQSPFELFLTCWFCVPYQDLQLKLTQMVTVVPGRGGLFQSVRVPNNSVEPTYTFCQRGCGK